MSTEVTEASTAPPTRSVRATCHELPLSVTAMRFSLHLLHGGKNRALV